MKYSSPREALRELLRQNPGLEQKLVHITTRGLKTEEAIGNPDRQDFPLLTGREVLVQAELDGVPGQAFTSDPVSFAGSVTDIINLPGNRPGSEAVVVATLNALGRKLGITDHTVHCHDNEPETCGEHICQVIMERHGRCQVGIIGYQPAILEHCARQFGPEQVHITDLNPANIGEIRYGVQVWNGVIDTARLIESSDVILMTGTILVNGTYQEIFKTLGNKPVYFFGTTAAAMAALNGLPRICPMSG